MSATCWRRVVGAALAGLTMVATAASAEDEPTRQDFPTTEFAEGARSASVTADGLTATITTARRPDIDPDADVPVLAVTVGGSKVIEVPGVASGFDIPEAEASIAEIDPDNGQREVYFSSYSGGAHCCSTVFVVEEVGGKWVAVPIGYTNGADELLPFDGDGGYLDDLDGDGVAEIATADNRFLYRFDSYAASAAPLVIYAVRGGKVVDLSTDPRFRAAHRDWLGQIAESVEPSRRWTSKGFLAGWLAEKVRLGEGATAWADLNAHWDWDRDSGEKTCLTGGEPEDCPRRDLKVLRFPERLKLFLDQTGYRF